MYIIVFGIQIRLFDIGAHNIIYRSTLNAMPVYIILYYI